MLTQRAGKYQPTAYAEGNCSDVLATVNALIDITCNSLNDGNLDNLPPLSNGEWDCANVRGSIETLFDILQDAIVGGTLAGLPPLNKVTLRSIMKHLSASVTLLTLLTLLFQ